MINILIYLVGYTLCKIWKLYVLNIYKLAKCQLTLKKMASPSSKSVLNVGFNLILHDFYTELQRQQAQIWIA